MTRLLLKNVAVLDGTGAEPFAGAVLVEGNRIKQVAKPGETLPADGVTEIDGGGATLMPGLVESHCHVSFGDTADLESLGDIPAEEHTLLAMKNAKKLLDHGFTSAFSAAAAKPRLDIVIRDAINAGDIPGPRMLAASPELTVTAGLGDVRKLHMERYTFALICDGADEFRRVARAMVREGVDTIKINPSGDEFVPASRAAQTVMTEDEVAAACGVAKAHGRRLASHARSAESIKMSLRHGVEAIYHATLADEEAKDMLEADRDRVFVAPTLGASWAAIHEGAPFGLTEQFCADIGLIRETEIGIETMQDLKRRGVRVLPGGDYGFAWNPIGTNARDIEHFVKLLGFTPMEAILAATKQGGEIMGLADPVGQIKAGYLADILLVDGNPLADVSILQDASRLIGIIKDGEIYKAPPVPAAAARVAAE